MTYVYALLDPRYPSIPELIQIPHRPFYIGIGTGDRLHVHAKNIDFNKPYKKMIFKLIKSLLEKGLKPIELILADGLEREAAGLIERMLIAAIGTIMPVEGIKRGPLANLTSGDDKGAIGYKHRDESKAKIREAHLGRAKSNEHKEKLRQAALILSPIQNARPEVRAKLRQTTAEARLRDPIWDAKIRKAGREALAKYNQEPTVRAKHAERMRNRIISEDERMRIGAGVSAYVKGRLWINNGIIHKRIAPIDLQNFLDQGWVRGRKL